MENFEHILFDFDGTLFDSSKGVFKSFAHVAEHYGVKAGEELFATMIGPPLYESFNRCFHIPQEKIHEAIDVYREYYTQGGLYECTVYDGIPELIQELRRAGKKVYVATSKPEVYARKIIEHKGMTQLFDFIGGSDEEEKVRVNKIDVINYVLETNGLEDKKESVLMIGDRFYDVEGAHQAGIKCMGILWGFGSHEEFIKCGADYIEETPLGVKKSLVIV